jgi:hypothetical protein
MTFSRVNLMPALGSERRVNLNSVLLISWPVNTLSPSFSWAWSLNVGKDAQSFESWKAIQPRVARDDRPKRSAPRLCNFILVPLSYDLCTTYTTVE